MRVSHLLLFFCFACVLGCDDGEVRPPKDVGQDYYPLAIGSEWTYQVDSVIFDDGGAPNVLDTLSGFVRERIIESAASKLHGGRTGGSASGPEGGAAGGRSQVIARIRPIGPSSQGIPIARSDERGGDPFSSRLDGVGEISEDRFPVIAGTK